MTKKGSLAQSINAATRSHHTQLNFLITSLLPLALPPHASTPQKYTEGIAQVFPIYEALERCFRRLISRCRADIATKECLHGWAQVAKDDEAWRAENAHSSKTEQTREQDGMTGRRRSQDQNTRQAQIRQAAVLKALNALHIPELERTKRLCHDIDQQRSYHSAKERPLARTNKLRHINDIRTPQLDAFTTYITASISSKPHLILAYTWILYMALFSGGRYIRSKLRGAGRGFWGHEQEKEIEVDEYLSFWTFEGSEDGEDIKAQFKNKFAEAEQTLQEAEKIDIIEESVFIMRSMIDVVEEIMAMADQAERRMDKDVATEPSMYHLLIKHILPMGSAELVFGAANAVSMLIGVPSWIAAAAGR